MIVIELPLMRWVKLYNENSLNSNQKIILKKY